MAMNTTHFTGTATSAYCQRLEREALATVGRRPWPALRGRVHRMAIRHRIAVAAQHRYGQAYARIPRSVAPARRNVTLPTLSAGIVTPTPGVHMPQPTGPNAFLTQVSLSECTTSDFHIHEHRDGMLLWAI